MGQVSICNDKKITYLDDLAVIHFHYVEIKTVYPFARGEEIAPFLIETFTNVHEYLREG